MSRAKRSTPAGFELRPGIENPDLWYPDRSNTSAWQRTRGIVLERDDYTQASARFRGMGQRPRRDDRQRAPGHVTEALCGVVFHELVFVGDLVSFWTETLRIGNTSITTKVVVEVIRNGKDRVTVTEAQVVYVNLGEDRKPKPIRAQ